MCIVQSGKGAITVNTKDVKSSISQLKFFKQSFNQPFATTKKTARVLSNLKVNVDGGRALSGQAKGCFRLAIARALLLNLSP